MVHNGTSANCSLCHRRATPRSRRWFPGIADESPHPSVLQSPRRDQCLQTAIGILAEQPPTYHMSRGIKSVVRADCGPWEGSCQWRPWMSVDAEFLILPQAQLVLGEIKRLVAGDS